MKSQKKQIHLITKAIAIACLASIVLSWKLWLSERNFPTTPVLNFIPTLTHPIDYFILATLIISLSCIVFFKYSQKLIIAFILISVLAALLDLNRWQPWFYQYVLMFFVLSFYTKEDAKQEAAIILCFKLIVFAIYFWSGLQKLNPNFISDTFPWLMEPITTKIGEGSISYFKWLGYAFPLIETATGIILLINKLKKTGAFLAITMHLFILFALGPLGHKYNFVIWPWNLFMIFMNWQLFYKGNSITKNDFTSIINFKKQNASFTKAEGLGVKLKPFSIKFVLILFVMMPLLNFFNKWDSYISHNLYSGNTSNGIIYVSDGVKQKLPKHIKKYVSGEDNQIRIKYWCMEELGVPPYPEKRNFKAVANTFYKYATDKSEIYFEFTPKIMVGM